MKDIIFISGEFVADHPFSGVGFLKRILESNGFSVGVVEKPQSGSNILTFGEPNLFFAITSGAMDSMVLNYTPLKKLRKFDPYNPYDSEIPDRAVIRYANWVRSVSKKTMILGGTEASLRRFTHYDYWDNDLRKSILFDTRADLLLYGYSEKALIEVANRIKKNQSLFGIKSSCIISKELPKNCQLLPSHEEVVDSKTKFLEMQKSFSTTKCLAQSFQKRFIVQFPAHQITTQELDSYYDLPFSYDIPKNMEYLRAFQFSVVTHRGCFGDCNFCSINQLGGGRVTSRSKESILREIKILIKHHYFKGEIELSGPSANMYGMDCSFCDSSCIGCKNLNRSHDKIIDLIKSARKVPGIRKVLIKSGIRFDITNEEYLKVICDSLPDYLRIAPEHVSPHILKLMNKESDFKAFKNKFKKICPNQKLGSYFITAHPGSTLDDANKLAEEIENLDDVSVQIFTPTPMTNSTCMYYTGMDMDGNKIYVPYNYKDKKEQKRIIKM